MPASPSETEGARGDDAPGRASATPTPGTVPPPGPAHRIASLDGLRAISITGVLIAHIAGTRNAWSTDAVRRFGDIGNFGVRVFFVISGFLITSLLIREREKTGKTSLKQFYLRRFFRIFPAFYLFLAVVAGLHAAGIVALKEGDLLYAAIYLTNFHGDSSRAWTLGHIWSLSVEEQFYLIWPAVVAATGLVGAKRAAVGMVIAAPLLRMEIWQLFPQWHEGIGEFFPTVADTIAAGCVLALIRPSLQRVEAYERVLRSPLFALLPLSAFVANTFAAHARIDFLVLQTYENCVIAVTIDRFVRYPDGPLGKVLNLEPLAYVGKLSYSLYLWQQVFLNRTSDAWFTAFPQNIFFAAAAAIASYYVIEKPFLTLRERIEGKGKARAIAAPPAASVPRRG